MSDLLAAATLPGLELELRTDTQWATAYLDGAPFLTLQRRRVTDPEGGPVWRAYTTQGAQAFAAYSHQGAIRRAQLLARQQVNWSGFRPGR